MIKRVSLIMQGKDSEVKCRDLINAIPDEDYSDVDEEIFQMRVTNTLKRVKKFNENKEDVRVEVPLGNNMDVYADIVVGDIIWEIKKTDAKPPDLMQLAMYLIISGKKDGVLVAKSFNASVKELRKMLHESPLKFDLELLTHADLNIASQTTIAESKWLEDGGFSNGYSPEFTGGS